MEYELKKYSFGQTIGKGFALYFDNLFFLFLVSLVLNVPLFVFELYLPDFEVYLAGTGFNTVPTIVYFAARTLVQFMASIMLSGIFIVAMTDKYLGDNYSFTSILRRSIKIILPLTGLVIIITVVFLVPGMVIVLTARIHIVITIFLGIIYAVFGIIVNLGWMIAPQVLIFEHTGIKKALTRSWDLTSGHKWWLFGMMLVVALIGIIIGIPFDLIIEYLVQNNVDQTAAIAISQMETVLAGPISVCITVIIYFNIRIEKEAFDVQHMAEHFTKIGKGL